MTQLDTIRGTTCFGKITTQWEFISQRTACLYLEANKGNRNFIQRYSDRLGIDLQSALWQTTHEGIAFSDTGKLIDGQHRLNAIAKTGVGVVMLVTRGLDEKAVEAINRGKLRTLAHALQISGYTYADNRTVAIARQMIAGVAGINSILITDALIKKFIDANLEAITFARSLNREKTGPAAVAAAIARAYYHAQIERLARFPDAMSDTISRDNLQPGDASARVLKKSISTIATTGWTAGLSIYRKTQNALRAYLDGRDLTKVYESDKDLFPLPPEKRLSVIDPTP